MSNYNLNSIDDYFSSALLVSNGNHSNAIKYDQFNRTTSPCSQSLSIESSPINNCISKDLLRRLNSISPLEKRIKKKMTQSNSSKESLDNLSQENETEFQLMGFDNDSKELAAIKRFNDGNYCNLNQVKPTNNGNSNNKKKKKKNKRNNNGKEDYIMELFGRRGWVCDQCQNFNYESRNKCNRCKIPKIAKKLFLNKQDEQEILIVKNIENNCHIFPQSDWVCTYCFNLNYSFRQICNRCQLVNPHHASCKVQSRIMSEVSSSD